MACAIASFVEPAFIKAATRTSSRRGMRAKSAIDPDAMLDPLEN
jgi:hypothetical protein